jgi:hypothetical protein
MGWAFAEEGRCYSLASFTDSSHPLSLFLYWFLSSDVVSTVPTFVQCVCLFVCFFRKGAHGVSLLKSPTPTPSFSPCQFLGATRLSTAESCSHVDGFDVATLFFFWGGRWNKRGAVVLPVVHLLPLYCVVTLMMDC